MKPRVTALRLPKNSLARLRTNKNFGKDEDCDEPLKILAVYFKKIVIVGNKIEETRLQESDHNCEDINNLMVEVVLRGCDFRNVSLILSEFSEDTLSEGSLFISYPIGFYQEGTDNVSRIYRGFIPLSCEEKEYKITLFDIGKKIDEKKLAFKPIGINDKNESTEFVTLQQLQRIFNQLTDNDKIYKIKEAFDEGATYFKIDNCLLKAHFFAQVLKEVGSNFSVHQPESLNYPTNGLIKGTWYTNGKQWIKGNKDKEIGGYFKDENNKYKATINFKYLREHPDIAEKYGRKDLNKYGDGGIQRANSEMLANYVYANKYGNGVPESGDGSKYRGRGLIQLTFRDNYKKVNDEIQKFNKDLVDVLENPDAINSDVKMAIFSAMAFWKMNKINTKIGNNKDDDIVDRVTNIVNSLEDKDNKNKRKENFKLMKKIFDVDNCKL